MTYVSKSVTSLTAGSPDDAPRGFLSEEQCAALFKRCLSFAKGGGKTLFMVKSTRTGGVQWARNRAYVARDVHDTMVYFRREVRGAYSLAHTTRLDDAGLQEAIQFAERSLRYAPEMTDARSVTPPVFPIATPTLWSDATNACDAEARGDIVRQLIDPAEAAGLLAAGELRAQAKCDAVFSTDGFSRYYASTRISFSNTIRDVQGTSSGWAGTDDFDIKRVNIKTLAQVAFDKCVRSSKPVALEPGRYTTILEPQAVADLFSLLCDGALDRFTAEQRQGPFAGPTYGVSKIGKSVMDPNMTWSADPMDPEGGFLPFHLFDGMPMQPVEWISKGVLRELSYQRTYALGQLRKDLPLYNSSSWRLSGGATSMDEMIATTKRGLIVTRLSNVRVSDFNSFTCTGYTRDGLSLIEDGKIVKAVKNFRFTESPLFVFNKVDQLGPSKRVFSGNNDWSDRAWLAPTAKVHDFNFTQLADAV